MREGWISCAIGDVVEQVKRVQSLNDNEQYRLLGVRWYGMGAFHRETVTTASSKANKFFRVHTGDFIYNRLFAWKGAFAVIEDELDGHCVSGEFPVFRTDPERLLPEYLFHYMARPQIWDRILLESTGSTATSRNRWKEDRFLSMEIDLPPIDVQRRIVDLISSIDRARRAALALREVLARTREQLLRHLISACNPVRRAGWQDVSLGEIMALEYGKALKDVDRDGGDYPVYGSAGIVGWHSKAWVTEAPWIVVGRKGTAGSVHLVRSPGWPIDTTYWVSSKSSSVLVEFLYLLLQAADLPKLCAQTGVPGLNRERVYALKVLLPPLGEQRRIVEVVDAVDRCIAATEAESDAIGGLREQVLSELLQGKHEIPDSYDRFLDQEMA